jgi:RNA polymerase sigma-70 factor (ECF subfamily)
VTALALNARPRTNAATSLAAPASPAAPRRDELALAKAFARGEPAAVSAVYAAAAGPVFAYVAARLGDRTEAEDVVQDAFLTALRAAHSFDGRSALLTWIIGIARNKSRERLRALAADRRRRVRASEAAAALMNLEDDALPEAALQAAETGRFVGDALALLPPRHRAMLEAKYVEGLSLAAIAAREGLTPKAAESAVVRARRGFLRTLKALARSRFAEDAP